MPSCWLVALSWQDLHRSWVLVAGLRSSSCLAFGAGNLVGVDMMVGSIVFCECLIWACWACSRSSSCLVAVVCSGGVVIMVGGILLAVAVICDCLVALVGLSLGRQAAWRLVCISCDVVLMVGGIVMIVAVICDSWSGLWMWGLNLVVKLLDG